MNDHELETLICLKTKSKKTINGRDYLYMLGKALGNENNDEGIFRKKEGGPKDLPVLYEKRPNGKDNFNVMKNLMPTREAVLEELYKDGPGTEEESFATFEEKEVDRIKDKRLFGDVLNEFISMGAEPKRAFYLALGRFKLDTSTQHTFFVRCMDAEEGCPCGIEWQFSRAQTELTPVKTHSVAAKVKNVADRWTPFYADYGTKSWAEYSTWAIGEWANIHREEMKKYQEKWESYDPAIPAEERDIDVESNYSQYPGSKIMSREDFAKMYKDEKKRTQFDLMDVERITDKMLGYDHLEVEQTTKKKLADRIKEAVDKSRKERMDKTAESEEYNSYMKQ